MCRLVILMVSSFCDRITNSSNHNHGLRFNLNHNLGFQFMIGSQSIRITIQWDWDLQSDCAERVFTLVNQIGDDLIVTGRPGSALISYLYCPRSPGSE